MNIKSKLIIVVLAVLFSPIFFSITTLADEMNDKVDIVIHRVVPKTKDTFINNGGEPINTTQLREFEGINDVQFSVYEITDQLDVLLEQGQTLQEAQLNLIHKKYETQRLSFVTNVTTSTLNNEKGIAQFTLLLRKNQRQAYLIQETKTPKEVNVKSDQIVLITPAYNQYGEQMKTVHLYPKSIAKSTESPKKQIPEEPQRESGFNPKFLPNTGELLQSRLFIMGLTILFISGNIYIYYKKKRQVNEFE